jgi:hypothetical protein
MDVKVIGVDIAKRYLPGKRGRRIGHGRDTSEDLAGRLPQALDGLTALPHRAHGRGFFSPAEL